MASQEAQIQGPQEFKEALEARRRKALIRILELQDEGGSLEEIEQAKIKLALIFEEIAQYVPERRQQMRFETKEKVHVIKKAFQKLVSADLKAAIKARDDSLVKIQVLEARKAQFESRKVELGTEIEMLRGKISELLLQGADPTEINSKVRAAAQEIEDIEGWIAQIQKNAIPTAKQALGDAQVAVWNALHDVCRQARDIYSKEMNDYLAAAAEIWHSWGAAMQSFFEDYRDTRGPAPNSKNLVIDTKRTFFGTVQIL